jgi:hypothetical protein
MLAMLRKTFVAFVMLMCSTSYADISDGHFSSNQIFDVQYYWSGTTLNASNFIAPYDANFQHPTVSSGDYFAFFPSTTNAGTYGLGLYNSSGTLIQTVHNTGTLQAIGPDALFYIGSGFFGTVITTSAGYAYGSSASFTNMDTSVSASDATSYTWASTTPLAAGQTANSTPTPPASTYVAITNASVVSVTPTSNNSPAGEGSANAIDGNSSTKYLNFDRASAGFTIKLNQGKVIEKFTITTANDYAPRDPSKFSLFGSNDGRTWTTIVNNQSITLSDTRFATSADITFTNTNAYVYYFITFDSTKALDQYSSVSACVAGYGGGWLGTENCNSVQVSEVKYYYDSSNTTTSADAGNGTVSNPGTSGAVSSLNTTPTVVSSAPGTDIVSTSVSNGATTSSTTVTRGTTTTTSVTTDTRDRQPKVLNINRNITVTNTTPVTTTVVDTTPVTTTTVTTPTTVDTYSDNSTVTTNGTPVTTTSVTNTVVTTSTTVNDVQITSTDTPYSTRIDQMDKLYDINHRVNVNNMAEPFDRHVIVDGLLRNRDGTDRTLNVYINSGQQQSNTYDLYSYKNNNTTVGIEKRVERDLLVGLTYNRNDVNLYALDAGGSITKDTATLYGLKIYNDFVYRGEIGSSDNTFNSYHTLPELGLSNSANAKGNDSWAAARVYTPDLKGFRPFLGIRKDINKRDAIQETGDALSAVDYSLINNSTETKEVGIRFDKQLSNKWAIGAEASGDSRDLNKAYASIMYNGKNSSTILLKIGRQEQRGAIADQAQLQLRINF